MPAKHVSTISSLDPALNRGGRLKFEGRVTFLALAAGFPAVALCAFLLWYDGYSGRVQWTVDLFLVIVWLGVSFNLKQRIVRPLQTLSNILGGDSGRRLFDSRTPRGERRRARRSDARSERSRPNTARAETRRAGSNGAVAHGDG